MHHPSSTTKIASGRCELCPEHIQSPASHALKREQLVLPTAVTTHNASELGRRNHDVLSWSRQDNARPPQLHSESLSQRCGAVWRANYLPGLKNSAFATAFKHPAHRLPTPPKSTQQMGNILERRLETGALSSPGASPWGCWQKEPAAWAATRSVAAAASRTRRQELRPSSFRVVARCANFNLVVAHTIENLATAKWTDNFEAGKPQQKAIWFTGKDPTLSN